MSDRATILRQMRKAKGWTQLQLGTTSGFDTSQISRWENPELPDPAVDSLVKLANALECTTDELLGRAKSPVSHPVSCPYCHGTLPETRTASPRDTPGTEHHFLLWFRHNVRLGPAEGDIIERMSRKYFDEFGSLPDGWDGCDECGEPPAACECTSNWRKDGR